MEPSKNQTMEQQLTPPIDNSRNLAATEKLRIQEIVGTLLYYGRAVARTQSVALGSLASAQATGTEKTPTPLYNYSTTQPAIPMPKASDLYLWSHMAITFEGILLREFTASAFEFT